MFLRKYIFWWKFCCFRFKQGKTKKKNKKKNKLLVNRKKDLSRIFFQIMFLGSSFNQLNANKTFVKYNKNIRKIRVKIDQIQFATRYLKNI
jgi:hypothetical protein